METRLVYWLILSTSSLVTYFFFPLQDTEKLEVDYSLLDEWGNFDVDSQGRILTYGQVDRESHDGSNGVIRILATDRGHPKLSSTATVEIEVLDSNDCPPGLLGNPVFHVAENVQPTR